MLSDHLGSVRVVVDATTGEVVQELEYDEFGRVTRNTNPGFQPFGFAGGLYDHHTRLTHFGARDYDALTGRWLTPDPAGLGGGTNVYEYSASDPVNLVDPSGLSPCNCANPRLVPLDPGLWFTTNPRSRNPIHSYFAPDFAAKLSDAVWFLNLLGIVPQINSGYRTESEQQWLRNGGSGSNPAAQGVSWHQLGYSIDVNGTTTPDFLITRGVMEALGFTWGGRWTGKDRDPPHFQIRPPSSDRQGPAIKNEIFFKRCLNST